MAFRAVTFNTTDIKKHKGQVFQGLYKGFHKIQTAIGEQVIWEFHGGQGPFGVYGFTTLNMAMDQVEVGQEVRLTYLGQKPVQTKRFGLKDVHQVLVEVNEDGEGVDDGHIEP